jgi:hypothetical protein
MRLPAVKNLGLPVLAVVGPPKMQSATLRHLLLALILTSSTGVTSASTILIFNTGVNPAGTPLPNGAVDPHYVLSSTDATAPGPNALVVNPAAGWTNNTATSKWISQTAGAQGAAGAVYTYTTTFGLTGFDLATTQLSGQLAADDSANIILNGIDLGTFAPSPGWATFHPFLITSGFNSGTNTLSFQVVNTTGGPSGLQVQVSGEGTPQLTPEPATLGLIGLGLAALIFVRRK